MAEQLKGESGSIFLFIFFAIIRAPREYGVLVVQMSANRGYAAQRGVCLERRKKPTSSGEAPAVLPLDLF